MSFMSFFNPGIGRFTGAVNDVGSAYSELERRLGQADIARNTYRGTSASRMQPLERLANRAFADVESYGDIKQLRPMDVAAMEKAANTARQMSQFTAGLGNNAFNTQGNARIQLAQQAGLSRLGRELGSQLASTQEDWRKGRLAEATGLQGALTGEDRFIMGLSDQGFNQAGSVFGSALNRVTAEQALKAEKAKAAQNMAAFGGSILSSVLGIGK